MPQRHLDEEIKTLRDLLLRMSDLVDEQLAAAIDAVSKCDVEQAEAVRRRDDEVDQMELEVDYQCERILALFTPVAVDLRLLITAVKINTDLERIADHAKNLAKYTQHFEGYAGLIEKAHIPEMADEARRILHEAQDAFIRRDRILARQVLAHDRQVDRMHREAMEAVTELLRQHPDQAQVLVYLVVMSKSVERIADHAKNIAERVVFLVEGIDIRHRKVREARET